MIADTPDTADTADTTDTADLPALPSSVLLAPAAGEDSAVDCAPMSAHARDPDVGLPQAEEGGERMAKGSMCS